MSFDRNPDLQAYTRNRILRIYPGLLASFVFTLMILLFFKQINFSIMRKSEFILWTISQISIFQYFNPTFLRTFGSGVLNGSLWTIPVELEFYMILPVIFFSLNRLKSLRHKNVLIIILIVWSLIILSISTNLTAGKYVIIGKLLYVTVFPHLYMFCFGLLMYLNFHNISRYIRDKLILWTVIYLGINYLFKFIPETNIINTLEFH
jgi:peptidoglycan/LPS O-acetylase OafA/YrhL